MGRTEKIFSKVRRNIHKISERDIKDRIIYQTMQEAQKQIIMLTQCLEKEISVTTVADQESYDLLTYTTGFISIERPIIGEIKSHKLPSTWNITKLDFITKEEYDQLDFIDYSSETPLKACVFNRKIYLYPIPTSAAIIKLTCYLEDSITEISDSTSSTIVQPEIQVYWDKALEYYTTSELFDEPDIKEYWMNKFEKEIAKFEGKPHAKHQYPIVPDCNW